MDKASGTNEIKQDSFVKWVNQTAIFAGLIGGGLYVATSLLGSYLLPFISTDALDPAAQGLIIGMCGFCYGPIFGLFIGLVEIVFLRIYLRSNLKEPDWKLRRVIFGVSALVGIGVPLILLSSFFR
jgi:hypothetical protein